MNKIYKQEDMFKIANFFNENDLCGENITVSILVDDLQTLNRINDDIYYRNTDGKDKKMENVNEIIVNVYNTKFKFTVKE